MEKSLGNGEITKTRVFKENDVQYFGTKPVGVENYLSFSRRSKLDCLQNLSVDFVAILASCLRACTPIQIVSNLQFF